MKSRRSWLIGLFVSFTAVARGNRKWDSIADDEFTDKVLAFDAPWELFKRKFVGCPLTGDVMSLDMCSKSKREIGVKEFKQCREAAKKLFKLKEADE